MTTREEILSLAEIEARAECARRGIDPDEICADGGVTAWMVVEQETRHFSASATQWGDSGPIPGVDFGDEFAPTPPAAEYEECVDCGGSGLALNMVGEPDECRKCHGNTVTPPAAEAPGQEPVARQHRSRVAMMWGGKVIQPIEWGEWSDWREGPAPVPNGDYYQAEERPLYTAPPTYADAEAKGFERGIETAAEAQPSTAENPFESAYQKGRFDGIMEYAAAIRSLASPAPKGET